MDRAERRETIEAYGLAAIGLMRGIGEVVIGEAIRDFRDHRRAVGHLAVVKSLDEPDAPVEHPRLAA